MKIIETYARAFLTLNILAIGSVLSFFLFSNIKKQDVLPADLVDTVNKVVTPRVVLPGTES